jgi:hypothetical protein
MQPQPESGLGNIAEIAEAERLQTQAEIDDAAATVAGDIQPFIAEASRCAGRRMRFVLSSLSRPVTVVIALAAVALCALLAVVRMRFDIFPPVGDPGIYVAQPYAGMDPAQMEGYRTYCQEYHFLYISCIDHVESRSIQGAALMKLAFHQGTNMSQAMAETVGYVNARGLLCLEGASLHSSPVSMREASPRDRWFSVAPLILGASFRISPFATLPGVSAPPKFGGNQRTIVVTQNPDKLQQ